MSPGREICYVGLGLYLAHFEESLPNITVRLPLLLLDQLSVEQMALYKDIKSGIASEFNPSF